MHISSFSTRTLLFIAAITSGCSSDRTDWQPVPLTEPLKGYVAIADRQAVRVIDEWNNSKDAADYFAMMREPQIILKLEDYRREMAMACLQDYAPWPNRSPYHPVLGVTYELTKGIGILGHPTHYSVWIYMDTLKTKVFGGE